VKPIFRSWFRRFKVRIDRRLDPVQHPPTGRPVLAGRDPDYDVSCRDRATVCGGLGAIHTLVRHLGLPAAIDDRLHVLRLHLPYHESDHVLALAYNALCDGTCLDDLDRLRQDEPLLDALGARRLPDPTTAGDFCRRFARADLEALHDAIDVARLRVWAAGTPWLRSGSCSGTTPPRT
jgi:hypothetical protein